MVTADYVNKLAEQGQIFVHAMISSAISSVHCSMYRSTADQSTTETLKPNVCSMCPMGSPPPGGDVAVYVFDMNQPSCPLLFILLLCLFLSS